MTKRVKQLYRCKETPRGGKRGRYCNQLGDKSHVEGFARAMRKLYGDRYTYRVVKAPAGWRPK